VSLGELPTPCALVEEPLVRSNTERMADRVTRLGARLRPHVKTHKTVEGARLQIRGHFGGITVSTLAEARAFAAAGFGDVTYAVPISPQKLSEAAELARGLERLTLLVDGPAAATAVEARARENGRPLSVMLEVDCGGGRSGVDPRRRESVAVGLMLFRSPHVDLRGVLTHAGQSYACRNPEEIRRVARVEREVTVKFADELRAAGAEVREVSVGSTPTIGLGESLAGVTEVRPGNYVFYDAFQAAIGSCSPDQIAFSVLATVIASHPESGRLVLDAGALALSQDPGPTHVNPSCGFGQLRQLDGSPIRELRLAALSQEHGTVRIEGPLSARSFPVGTRLRIVPNHSCLAAACFDRYHVVRGAEVVGEWLPTRGW
jgi:D-serine deaminase-like pyridoxal phosphate-dependent protein